MKDATKCSFELKSLRISVPQTDKIYNFGKASEEPAVTKTPTVPLTIEINDLKITNDFDVELEGDEYGQAMRFGEAVINATNTLCLGIATAISQQEQARREERKAERAHNKDMRLIEMKHEIELKKLDDTLDAAKHSRIQSRRNVGDLGT